MEETWGLVCDAELDLYRARQQNHAADQSLRVAEDLYFLNPAPAVSDLAVIEAARENLADAITYYREANAAVKSARQKYLQGVEIFRARYGREPDISNFPRSLDGGSMLKKILPYSRVDSVQGFLKIVDTLEQIYGPEIRDAGISRWTLYRGHSDELYQPEPNIYRAQKGTSAFFTNEQLMIQEVVRLMPDEFSGLNAFQTLAKLQHYGLPTRLLDVTTNPLVALFFACGGSDELDGEVVVFPNQPVFGEDSLEVKWLAKWGLNGRWGVATEQEIFDAVGYNRIDESLEQDACPELLTALTQRFTAVRPKHTNDRLRSQSGAFLIAGVTIDPYTHESGDLFIRPHRGQMDPITGIDKSVEIHEPRIIVESGAKARILRQLNQLNINWSAMFPDPQNIIKYVHDGFRNRIFGETHVSRRIDMNKDGIKGE